MVSEATGSSGPAATALHEGATHFGCLPGANGIRYVRLARSGKSFVLVEAGVVSDPIVARIETECTVVMRHGQVHSQRIEGAATQGQPLRDIARDVAARQFDSVETVHDAQAIGGGATWVSLARESDADAALEGCRMQAHSVSRLVGIDAALAAAFAASDGKPPAILVDIGAEVCQIVVVGEDGIALSADAEPGGESLMAALAADLSLTLSEFRSRLSTSAPLPPRAPRAEALLGRMLQSVESILRDHARESGMRAETLLAAPLWVSGELATVPGWRAMIVRALGERAIGTWPQIPSLGGKRVESASIVPEFGAALIGLGYAGNPPNLAPASVRKSRSAWIRAGRIQAAACLLAVIALGFSITDLAARFQALSQRQAEVAVLAAAATRAPTVAEAREARDEAYRSALPSLYLHKRTRDFVSGLRLLQGKRSSQDHWFALVADLETYTAGSLPQGTPASAPELQVLYGTLGRTSGLVAEIGFRPGAADPLAQVGGIIRELGSSGQFKEVDLLPARSRQPLADKSVFAADGSDFAVRMVAAPFEHVLPQPVLRRSTPALFSQSR